MNTILHESIPLLRGALSVHLNGHIQISSLQILDTTNQLEDIIAKSKTDLLWLDGSLEAVSSQSLIGNLKKKFPDLKILVFGNETDVIEIKKIFKQGAHAYLCKTCEAGEINDAIEALAQGKSYLPPSFQSTLHFWISTPDDKKMRNQRLTDREKEVLQLIVDEFTTIEIAKKLFISQCTVETHRLKLIQKLGVKNTAGLVREAIANRLCFCF
ncbi:MAG: response regulator transcription factor [Saprospiraceae bacterium]|nr:response regulator transcription factor [Saprospiraceae bacterium]